MSLSASYELDFWGKNRATLRAAEDLAVASRFDREVVALTVVAAVANAFADHDVSIQTVRQEGRGASLICLALPLRRSSGPAVRI